MSHRSASVDSSLLVREIGGSYRVATGAEVVEAALCLLSDRLQGAEVMSSPQIVRDYLCLKLGDLEHEVFAVVMLDAHHRVIEYVELFRGTVSQTALYPREVVKEALARNAAAVLLVHNHPTKIGEASRADEAITITLKSSLALVDVRVLDHLIVAGRKVVSFAERGLL